MQAGHIKASTEQDEPIPASGFLARVVARLRGPTLWFTNAALHFFQNSLSQPNGVTLATSGVLNDLFRNDFGHRVAAIS
jgi:hypothetical protein